MEAPAERVRLGLPTLHGGFAATYSRRGLARLEFPASAGEAPTGFSSEVLPQIAIWHRQATTAVERLLRGEEPGPLPPLDLSVGSDFQQAVWRELLSIPLGQVRTYGELATRLGRPGCSRAVGAACGANPVPVIVPCHRVLAAGGKLGGFSGGLDWKKKLLAIERGGGVFALGEF